MSGGTSIRDRLYEQPGPRTRRRVAAFTVVALIGLGILIYLIVRQFAEQGQLEARYWDFFLKWSTWRYLLSGLLSTLRAALTAAVIAIALGFVMMRGKLQRNPVPRWIAVAAIEFTRGVRTSARSGALRCPAPSPPAASLPKRSAPGSTPCRRARPRRRCRWACPPC